MADLLISDKDALLTYGVRMGQGFIEALYTPADCKEFVSNKCRVENGTRYVINEFNLSEREVDLPFVLIGGSISDAESKRKLFLTALQGWITLRIPPINEEEVFHLIPRSICSLKRNRNGNLYEIKVRFVEPDPTNRTA